MLLDTLSYTNGLRQVAPEHKFIFSMGMLPIVFFSHEIVLIAVVLWMSVWIVGYAKIPLGFYLAFIGAASLFLFMSLPALLIGIIPLADAAQTGNHALAGLSVGGLYLYIDKLGAAKAQLLFLRSIAATACLYFVLLTTPFAEMLQVLQRVRLPQVLLDILLIMYRFIFVLVKTANELRIAQIARGGHRGFRSQLQDAGRLIVQLFIKTMYCYRKLQIGLQSRGFAEEIVVMSHPVYRTPGRYKAEAVIGMLLLLALEWAARREGW